MTFQQFIEKYNGKYLEVAGSANAKYQCVDLANGYIRDVLGQPIIEWTNAVDFPSKAGNKYDYIKNTPIGIPKEGDIIIWKPSPGHVAVFIEGNVDKFKSFDQNFPIGSPCHIQDHTYLNVIGWLRFKGNLPTEDIIKQRADAFVAVAEKLNKPVDKDIILADIDNLITIERKLEESNKSLNLANQQLQDVQKKADDMDKKVKILDDKNVSLLEALQELKDRSEKQSEEIGKLQTKIEELKDFHPIESVSTLDLIIITIKRFLGRR